MKRSLAILLGILVYSSIGLADNGVHAVIAITPSRSYYFEDETILFDGSGSWTEEGEMIVEYTWKVNGVTVSTASSFSQAFPLQIGQASQVDTIQLKVKDDLWDSNQASVTILIKRRPLSYFYLTDHLGSIRATVQGGRVLVHDDFSDGLGKWTVAEGSGFAIENGELHASASGNNNLLVLNSPKPFTDGIISVDVKTISTPYADPTILVRYQDEDDFYMVHPYGNTITIYKFLWGTNYLMRTASLPTGYIQPGTWYHLQVTAEGAKLLVYWNNQLVIDWTDSSAFHFLSGSVGFRQCLNRHVHWDNFTATTEGPGEVVSADDYDAWGSILEGRSYVEGGVDTRYKFTGKERDVESLYDYCHMKSQASSIGFLLACEAPPTFGTRLSSVVHGQLSPWPTYTLCDNNSWLAIFFGRDRESQQIIVHSPAEAVRPKVFRRYAERST